MRKPTITYLEEPPFKEDDFKQIALWECDEPKQTTAQPLPAPPKPTAAPKTRKMYGKLHVQVDGRTWVEIGKNETPEQAIAAFRKRHADSDNADRAIVHAFKKTD